MEIGVDGRTYIRFGSTSTRFLKSGGSPTSPTVRTVLARPIKEIPLLRRCLQSIKKGHVKAILYSAYFRCLQNEALNRRQYKKRGHLFLSPTWAGRCSRGPWRPGFCPHHTGWGCRSVSAVREYAASVDRSLRLKKHVWSSSNLTKRYLTLTPPPPT